jgi:acetate kinase
VLVSPRQAAPPLRILVVNAGSSSLRLRVIGADDRLEGTRDLGPPTGRHDPELAAAVGELGPIDAVGHRVVHGGTRFSRPIRLDEQVIAELRALTELAPLHQPKSLAALEALRAILPDLPAVACFDSAFHATLPASAATYALPHEWNERYQLRRYGFHGLSHAYASRRAAELLGRPLPGLRLVTCHLGAGASLAAVRDGRSVDTTMGFTPLEGLVMATRSGDVDPGLLLWLEEHEGLAAHELAQALETRSGLLGLTGSADMREVLVRAQADDSAARLGLDVYLHRLRAGISAMAAALGGIDALVFTGGVGEHAPSIRAAALDGLDFLGLAIDPERNTDAAADAEIGRASSPARTLVVTAREDLEIARGVREVLAGA